MSESPSELCRSASSFPDLETAEAVIATMLQDDAERVVKWMTMPNGCYHLDMLCVFDDPVGTVSIRGQEPQPAYHARVVLRRDPEMPHGYHIHTVMLF